MPSGVNQEAYGNQAWGRYDQGPWANPTPPWNYPAPPFWQPAGISRPVAILFTVLGFMFWWPVGLALLFYMIGTRRMGCFGKRARQAMYQAQNGQAPSPWDAWKSWTGGQRPAASSGNHAFDEYKNETLRRLEEEQQEFGSFLERLRFAKDKAEFDQFMAERRGRPPAQPGQEQPAT